MPNSYKTFRHRPIRGYSATLAGADYNLFMNGSSTKSVSISTSAQAIEIIPNALVVGGRLAMIGNAIPEESNVLTCNALGDIVTLDSGDNFSRIPSQLYFAASGLNNEIFPVTSSFDAGPSIEIPGVSEVSLAATECRFLVPAEEYKPANFLTYTEAQFGDAVTNSETITVAAGTTVKFDTDRYPIYSIAVRATAGAIITVIPAGD